VHEEHPIVHEQISNRWKRILENLPPANETESRGSFPNNGGQTSSNRGRGGCTIVRGRGGGRGAARGGFRPTQLIPQVHPTGLFFSSSLGKFSTEMNRIEKISPQKYNYAHSATKIKSWSQSLKNGTAPGLKSGFKALKPAN
jgi:hypothetical protein